MQYEVYEVLKTKLKSIKVFDTMKEAKAYVAKHTKDKVQPGQVGDLGIRTYSGEDV